MLTRNNKIKYFVQIRIILSNASSYRKAEYKQYSCVLTLHCNLFFFQQTNIKFIHNTTVYSLLPINVIQLTYDT